MRRGECGNKKRFNGKPEREGGGWGVCARTDEEHERLDPDAIDQEGLVDGVGLVLPDEPTKRGHDVGVRIQLLLVHQLCFEDVQSLPQQEDRSTTG